MRIPNNKELFEIDLATLWLDECGILCAVSKEEKRTVERYKAFIELLKKLMKNENKLCLLVDIYDTMPMSKEVIEYLAVEMPKYIKAQAVVSNNQILDTVTTALTRFNESGFPVKKFSSEAAAKEWLKQYL